ncbi:putative WRKY transcription factor 32 [Panicum miliaceum]|uniref:WRKY transcription factor 32 n=1 Tax=Panicum miliaceum TaxID=4540 RepID=A0A3L6PQU9_PANMI|nr:putative WRKY transcription factor 32 [Panicum miliaceum]
MADGDPAAAPAPAREKPSAPAAAVEVEETRPPPPEPPGGLVEEKRQSKEEAAAAEVETRPPPEAPGAPPAENREKEAEAEAKERKEVEKGMGDETKEKRGEEDKGKGPVCNDASSSFGECNSTGTNALAIPDHIYMFRSAIKSILYNTKIYSAAAAITVN